MSSENHLEKEIQKVLMQDVNYRINRDKVNNING